MSTKATNVLPEKDRLIAVLAEAWKAHSEFQHVILDGENDEAWPGWYAAFVIGRLGDFTTPSRLTRLLESVQGQEDWTDRAASHILAQLGD